MLVLCILVRVVETSSSVVEQDANNAITVTKQTEMVNIFFIRSYAKIINWLVILKALP